MATNIIPRFGEDITLSDCSVSVNTVNTQGVGGKGIALAFKRCFPNNFVAYQDACASGKLSAGGVFFFTERNIIIANAATKDHWRNPSQLDWINNINSILSNYMQFHGLKSIAIPPLGCGLGGLQYSSVLPLIIQSFQKTDCDIHLYGDQAHKSEFYRQTH